MPARKSAIQAARPAAPEQGGGSRRNPERTSKAILAAATREFAGKGYSGAGVNEIARRAGINKRMLYHYFGDKEGLYLAVFEAAYSGIRSAESRLQLDESDPVEGIRTLCLFTWQYYIRHPEFINLLQVENQAKARYIRRSQRIGLMHLPLVDTIGRLVERGQALGEFNTKADPVEVYITIAAIGYFYFGNRWTLSAIFSRNLNDKAALDAWGEHIVEVVLAYLRGTPPAKAAKARRRREPALS